MDWTYCKKSGSVHPRTHYLSITVYDTVVAIAILIVWH